MNLHNAQFLNVIINILASLPYFKEERTARINTKNQTLFCAARTYGKHAQTPTRLLLAWRTKAQPEGKHKLSTLRPPLLSIPIRFEYPNRYPAISVSFWAVPFDLPSGRRYAVVWSIDMPRMSRVVSVFHTPNMYPVPLGRLLLVFLPHRSVGLGRSRCIIVAGGNQTNSFPVKPQHARTSISTNDFGLICRFAVCVLILSFFR